MCTNLAQYQMAYDQAGQQPAASGQSAAMIQAGGSMQAGASILGALGDLAAGVMRARALKGEAEANRRAGQQKAAKIRVAGEEVLSSARAAATGAGVSVRSGSVLDAERAIVKGVEQDAGVAIINGNAQAGQMDAQAGYALASGMSGFSDGVLTAADKWVRSRRATQQPTVGRQADTIYIPDNLA